MLSRTEGKRDELSPSCFVCLLLHAFQLDWAIRRTAR